MSLTLKKPSTSFWIVSVIALLWNLMGVLAYLIRAFVTDEMIATLPAEQQAEFAVVYPSWVTAAFAMAVFCGTLGAILLLMRKKLATLLFAISAIAAIAQHIYIFTNVAVNSYVMPVLVIIVCAFLVWFSRKFTEQGILK